MDVAAAAGRFSLACFEKHLTLTDVIVVAVTKEGSPSCVKLFTLFLIQRTEIKPLRVFVFVSFVDN